MSKRDLNKYLSVELATVVKEIADKKRANKKNPCSCSWITYSHYVLAIWYARYSQRKQTIVIRAIQFHNAVSMPEKERSKIGWAFSSFIVY